MDFSKEFDTIWFFDSCIDTWLRADTMEKYHLRKEFVGKMGIEQNDFGLYRITRE